MSPGVSLHEGHLPVSYSITISSMIIVCVLKKKWKIETGKSFIKWTKNRWHSSLPAAWLYTLIITVCRHIRCKVYGKLCLHDNSFLQCKENFSSSSPSVSCLYLSVNDRVPVCVQILCVTAIPLIIFMTVNNYWKKHVELRGRRGMLVTHGRGGVGAPLWFREKWWNEWG